VSPEDEILSLLHDAAELGPWIRVALAPWPAVRPLTELATTAPRRDPRQACTLGLP
jgi:hypothetical protein